MKTLRMIGIALFAVLMCVNFASCSSEEDVEPDVPQKPKEYMVSLGFTGEISVSESTLSRASGNDLYGINVLCCPATGDTKNYTAYAYGLFDDLTTINITLLEGYKYKFVATMIVDGKDKIYCNGGKYQEPFMPNNIWGCEITNSFVLSKSAWLDGLSMGFVRMIEGTFRYPNIDRYYGEYIDYIPTENGSVSINMLRTVFGFKVIAENLTEGTLSVKIPTSPILVISHPETEVEDVFAFYSVRDAFITEDYSLNIPINFTWTKTDGAIIPLGSHDITFKRLKRTIVTVKISDQTAENTMDITLEDGEITDGENVTIENGEIVNGNVETGTEE